MTLKLSCITGYFFPNLPKKRNLIAVSLILIPEYGQSNAIQGLKNPNYICKCKVFCVPFSKVHGRCIVDHLIQNRQHLLSRRRSREFSH